MRVEKGQDYLDEADIASWQNNLDYSLGPQGQSSTPAAPSPANTTAAAKLRAPRPKQQLPLLYLRKHHRKHLWHPWAGSLAAISAHSPVTQKSIVF